MVFVGAGAAAISTAEHYVRLGVRRDRITLVDKEGPVWAGRGPLDRWKARFAEGVAARTREEAFEGADVFVGLSSAGAVGADLVRRMGPRPIVLALANPVPEIMPEEAAEHVRVMATGRSDYSNQINNVLCFPGFFRGLLDCRASRVTQEMKLAAAEAIASIVGRNELHEEYVIPSVFNKKVAPAVARAVVMAASKAGVARRRRRARS